MRVLLTGATGFLGTHLAARLAADGCAVRALVRRASAASPAAVQLARDGVEVATGSLDPPLGLAEALRDVDAVVHCAGGGKATEPGGIERANVVTTQHLLDAARAHARPGARFVLISSLAAHGPSADGSPPAPGAPARPTSRYGRSKLEAERLVLAAQGDLRVAVVRPPPVYGPRDTNWLALFRAAARGVVPLAGRGHTTSVVYADDCARAVSLVLDRSPPSGRVYFVDDGRAHAWEDLALHVGAAVGRPRVATVAVPLPMLAFAATASELVARLRGVPSFLSRDKADDARQRHWVSDASAIREELGWAPRVEFREGARETARWYRDAGWL